VSVASAVRGDDPLSYRTVPRDTAPHADRRKRDLSDMCSLQ